MNPKFNLWASFLMLVFLTAYAYEDNVFDFPTDAEEEESVKHPQTKGRLTGASGSGSRYIRRPNHNKPRQKNLDRAFLLDLMGEDYKTSWMSDEEPNPQRRQSKITSNEVTAEEFPERWAADRLFQQLQRLNLSSEFSSEPELSQNPKVQTAIKSWLLRRASCPIEFTWQDLGATFWPRWVRKGECVDRQGTCSWPPGMHCVPAGTITVHILRWQCKERRKRTVVETKGAFRKKRPTVPIVGEPKRKKKKCDWYRVPFPITIDCFCTC